MRHIISSLISILLSRLLSSVAEANQFTFDIDCAVTALVCGQLRNSLNSAGARISSQLQLTAPINVIIQYESFGNTVSARNTLGGASPAAFIEGRLGLSKDNVWYTQAAVKQFVSAKTITFSQYDIASSFNSDINFWFSSSGVEITAEQTDFEIVVAHELTHGLGFSVQWVTGFNGEDTRASFPVFYATTATPSQFSRWAPIDAMAYSVLDVNQKLGFKDYYKDIVTYNPNNKLVSTLDIEIRSSRTAYTAATRVYTASTSNNLILSSIYYSSNILLFAPSVYQEGSSVSHLDQSAWENTSDFLMRPYARDYRGFTFDAILAPFYPAGNTSLYGPATLAIMSSIGFKTRLNSNANFTFVENISSTSAGDILSGCCGRVFWLANSLIFIVALLV